MVGDWAKVPLDVHADFLGVDVQLHGGENLRLEGLQLKEELFKHRESGSLRTCEWLFGSMINFDRENLNHYIGKSAFLEAANTGRSQSKPALTIENNSEALLLLRAGVWGDFSRLLFDVELTVTPKLLS